MTASQSVRLRHLAADLKQRMDALDLLLGTVETPAYGCGPYPGLYLGDPIGGGLGYRELFTEADARLGGVHDHANIVHTAAELKTQLAASVSGDIVYIADGYTCTIDGTDSDTYYLLNGTRYMVWVPVGVRLVGGRGGVGVTPGKITIAANLRSWETWRQCIVMNTNCRVMGLDVDGGDYTQTQTNVNDGIYMRGDNCEVANNIVHGWGHAGIRHWSGGGAGVLGGRAHHNYITYNQVDGYGYGIASEGYGTATRYPEYDGNYLDYHRHHFSGNGGTTTSAYYYASYDFHHNFCGANCYGTPLDQHGGGTGATLHLQAGGNWKMRYNTCLDTSAFVGIRGRPVGVGQVFRNWTYADPTAWISGVGGGGDPKCRVINEQLYTAPGYGYQCPQQNISGVITDHAFANVESHDNWYGSDPPMAVANPDMKVGEAWQALTIDSGHITLPDDDYPAARNFTIEGEGAASDALTDIVGGREGMIICIKPVSDSHTITVTHAASGAEKIWVSIGKADVVLDDLEDTLALVRLPSGMWSVIGH